MDFFHNNIISHILLPIVAMVYIKCCKIVLFFIISHSI
nr:MAG TPA: hypothetical protein [Caudoviricetes sp.]